MCICLFHNSTSRVWQNGNLPVKSVSPHPNPWTFQFWGGGSRWAPDLKPLPKPNNSRLLPHLHQRYSRWAQIWSPQTILAYPLSKRHLVHRIGWSKIFDTPPPPPPQFTGKQPKLLHHSLTRVGTNLQKRVVLQKHINCLGQVFDIYLIALHESTCA